MGGRQVLRQVADVVGGRVGALQVAIACRRAKGGRMVVLDIDNTLADSWPTFTRSWPGERARLDAIDVLPRMKAVAHDAAVQRGDAVLFLTHRSWRHWAQTYRWLRRNGFAATPLNVVLVASPHHKLRHLRRCAGAARVTYWDDLSHGHERGEVAFYEGVISEVRELDLEYLGWDEIRAVLDPSPADRV